MSDTLEITGLSLRARNRFVADALNLKIGSGEIYALLGPDVAAKAALVRATTRARPPRQGTISINGQSLTPKSARQVSRVVEPARYWPTLTLGQTLTLAARLAGIKAPEIASTVSFAAEACGLADRLATRASRLSAGEALRAALAHAMLRKPALLIIEDPRPDPDTRIDLFRATEQLAKSGTAILVLTHDLDLAESMATRVGFLRSGRIEPEGPPRALVAQTFGDSREILVELKHAPTAPQAALLRRVGFAAQGSEMCWSVVGHATSSTAANLSERLNTIGLSLRELRLREPGLGTLFDRIEKSQPRANDNLPPA